MTARGFLQHSAVLVVAATVGHFVMHSLLTAFDNALAGVALLGTTFIAAAVGGAFAARLTPPRMPPLALLSVVALLAIQQGVSRVLWSMDSVREHIQDAPYLRGYISLIVEPSHAIILLALFTGVAFAANRIAVRALR